MWRRRSSKRKPPRRVPSIRKVRPPQDSFRSLVGRRILSPRQDYIVLLVALVVYQACLSVHDVMMVFRAMIAAYGFVCCGSELTRPSSPNLSSSLPVNVSFILPFDVLPHDCSNAECVPASLQTCTSLDAGAHEGLCDDSFILMPCCATQQDQTILPAMYRKTRQC